MPTQLNIASTSSSSGRAKHKTTHDVVDNNHKHRSNDQPAQQTNMRPRRNKSAPVSTIVVPNPVAVAVQQQQQLQKPQKDRRSLILQMSGCCSTHRKFHQQQEDHDINNSNNNKKTKQPMHKECQQDLNDIRKLLPRVEGRTKGGPQEMAHMCAFYRDVLRGGYCPHAPKLFMMNNNNEDDNDDGRPAVHEVLRRVHFLYKKLIAPKIVANTRLGAEADRDASERLSVHASLYVPACHRPALTTWEMEKTVAHFLHFLTNDPKGKTNNLRYVQIIEQDFTQLLLDLAILSQYFQDLEQQNDSSSALEVHNIQIVLFPKILAIMSHDTNTTITEEFVLDITNLDAVWCLQSATLNAMNRWYHLRHDSIIKFTTQDRSEINQWEATEQSTRQLLAALRPIFSSSATDFLAERTRSAAMVLLLETHFVFPAGIAVISTKATETALDISILLEVTLLVVHAIGHLLLRQQQWRYYAAAAAFGDEENHAPSQADDLVQGLSILLRRTLMFPPRVVGHSPAETKRLLRQSALPPLLETCLPWLRPTATLQNAPKANLHLEELVLRAIHVCLLEPQQPVALCQKYASVAVVGPLLELMKDARLSSIALCILTALLRPLRLHLGQLCQRNETMATILEHRKTFWVPPIPPAPSANAVQVVQMQADQENTSPPHDTKNDDNNNTQRKSKRRLSLLDSNPLTIQSPPSKRPKSSHAGSSINNNGTDENVTDVMAGWFVEDLLHVYFSQTRRAAQSLVDKIVVGVADSKEVSLDVTMLAAGTRIMMRLAQTSEKITPTNIQSCSPCKAFLEQISSAWQSLTTLIHQYARGENGLTWTSGWQTLAELVVDCGLVYFNSCENAIVSESSPVDCTFRRSWNEVCSALGLVAAKLSSDNHRFKQDEEEEINATCRGNCACLLGALAADRWVDVSTFGTDLCLCDYSPIKDRWNLNVASSTTTAFERDCLVLMSASLPVPIRCCFLACLNIRKTLTMNGEECLSLPPCWSLLNEDSSLFKMLLEPKPLLWGNEFLSPALVLAALQIMVSCHQEPNSQLALVLNDFLRTVIFPAIETIKLQSPHLQRRAARTMYTVIRQLQLLHLALGGEQQGRQVLNIIETASYDLPFSLELLWTPYMMGLCDRRIDRNNHSCGGYDGLRREVTFRLSRAVMNFSEADDISAVRVEDLSPSSRLLRWKCVAWECLRLDTAVTLNEIMWLVQTPFLDSSESVRGYASQELGRVLLANKAYGLFAVFANADEDWSFLLDDDNSWQPEIEPSGGDISLPTHAEELHRNEQKKIALDRFISRLFNEVDMLISVNCEDSPTPTPSPTTTVLASDSPSKESKTEGQHVLRIRQKAAVRLLFSLCRFADFETTVGKRVIELALIRLANFLNNAGEVRCGSDPFESFLRHQSIPSASFRMLLQLSKVCELGKLMQQNHLSSFTSQLVSGVLVPVSGLVSKSRVEQGLDDLSPEIRKKRYFRLFCLIVSILVESSSSNTMDMASSDLVYHFVSSVVPHVLASLTLDRDFDSIRLFTGFKLFVQGALKSKTATKVSGYLDQEGCLGQTSVMSRAAGVHLKSHQLERQTTTLCLTPSIVEQMLPTIFMKSEKASLDFFIERVLDRQRKLWQLLQSNEHKIVKGLALALGRMTDNPSPVIRAIRAASIARHQDPEAVIAKMRSAEGDSSVSCNDDCSGNGRSRSDLLASQWLTSHFMYLIVNVIQLGWKMKSYSDKLLALRCLNGLLPYLLATEAPQYFPQILASVNAAIAVGTTKNKQIEHQNQAMQMRLLALEALSKYCSLVGKHDPGFLGQNLTSVVVALIPVLSESECVFADAQVQSLASRSLFRAVSLLEFLTSGELGKHLSGYFKEIPFLPAISILDGVRENLKQNRVIFDDFLIGTQNAQQYVQEIESENKPPGTSAIANTGGGLKKEALSGRIKTVSALLENENVSVRKVGLKHLLDLLRPNRALFLSWIDDESSSSGDQFLTKKYNTNAQAASFNITQLMGKLLTRCVYENDPDARGLLGACLGEIGAIGEHRLGDINMAALLTDSDSLDAGHRDWRLTQQPWKSQTERYEVQLVTKHLVVAMKAAPTSDVQHKIAFSIQQILHLLDKSAQETKSNGNLTGKEQQGQMSSWLRGQLENAGVLDVVEPFWTSDFSMRSQYPSDGPPFYRKSNTHHEWLSNWCRYMIIRSHLDESPWSGMLHACRTAVRPLAGLAVAEFIFPILVLDRLCFGTMQDRQYVFDELSDVFSSKRDGKIQKMCEAERRKAVTSSFMVIELLEFWAEAEKNDRQQGSNSSSLHVECIKADINSTQMWTAEDCIFRINELLEKVPLPLRAQAAASVGMHSRALRLIEFAARKNVVEEVFNFTSDQNHGNNPREKQPWITNRHLVKGIDLDLLKDILRHLDNSETMAALDEDNSHAAPRERTLDSIRQNEAQGNWEGALRDYERILQLGGPNTEGGLSLQLGALRCLLQLGQFESVLYQASGIMKVLHGKGPRQQSSRTTLTKPLAVEAAWRLGKWESLSEMVEEEARKDRHSPDMGPEALFQIARGEAMLGLHQKNIEMTENALLTARRATLESLSSAARESYARAYPFIVRLHCLREIEDVQSCLCGSQHASTALFGQLRDSEDGWAWAQREKLLSSLGEGAVNETRLALARLANDSAMEGDLFFKAGKKARKKGSFNIAADSLVQAETIFSSPNHGNEKHFEIQLAETKLQLAKLKHDSGQKSTALRMLGQDNIRQLIESKPSEAKKLIVMQESHMAGGSPTRPAVDTILKRFARRVLKSTQWVAEDGLEDGSLIVRRFKIITEIQPHVEKGHFHFAKYIDTVIESRVSVLMSNPSDRTIEGDTSRADVIYSDSHCQEYMIMAMENYAESLKLSSKHVYQVLPRLLSLWFELTAIKVPDTPNISSSSGSIKRQLATFASSGRRRIPSQVSENSGDATSKNFIKKCKKANAILSMNFSAIKRENFYTALPQLVSQILHPHEDTGQLVRGMLTSVLRKFPQQSMWPLAWLLFSKDAKRKNIGKTIFKDAEKGSKKEEGKKLLGSAQSLLRYLHRLALADTKAAKKQSFLTVPPWRGEVSLCDFVAPVRGALTAVLHDEDSANPFPRQVPRMRDFSTKVHVMSSKARPKRLTAFVIPLSSVKIMKLKQQKMGSASPKNSDIGEMHFLVKQEARGDLRKDARVQDLNNVINRIMASYCDSGKRGSSAQNRQLRLRTFTVTCLSEETGILEWVPETASTRSLIQATHNPQADEFATRRHGRNSADLTSTVLRNIYENKCQNVYFNDGNLTRAGQLFEQLMLKEYPPVFYWWFVQKFRDPHAWYEARTKFILSAAVWSGVGHVIGLGDRHTENILLDQTNGECVHVDFDCIFDKGLLLPKPEVVPFRLTQNFLDAFGPTGADGVYESSLKLAMKTLRDNRDTLLSVLEPFIKDPIIDFKATRSSQSPVKPSSKSKGEMTQRTERQTRQAKHSLKVIDERLRGIYNLRNPNLKKYRRTDGFSVDQHDEMTKLLPLSVEGQVHKMIAEATSSENLVQLFAGWMSWL